MNRLSSIFCLLLFGLSFLSCDPDRIYEQHQKIADYEWSMHNTLRFEVEINDTIQPHSIYLNIRNTGAYAYSNMWVFVKKISPNGEFEQQKFECHLADNTGKWYGSGFGNIFDLQIPFQQNVIFPTSGKYVYEIVQGMRTDTLKEVVNVGVRIEKANQ